MEYTIYADTSEEARAEFVRSLAWAMERNQATPARTTVEARERWAIGRALENVKAIWEQARIVPKAAP